MTQQEWDAFSQFRENFKNKISQWNQFASQLIPLQKAAANKDTPNYPIENPIVYNTALDEITQEDSIKLIVIGDNPGKDEQLNKNLNEILGWRLEEFIAILLNKYGINLRMRLKIQLLVFTFRSCINCHPFPDYSTKKSCVLRSLINSSTSALTSSDLRPYSSARTDARFSNEVSSSNCFQRNAPVSFKDTATAKSTILSPTGTTM